MMLNFSSPTHWQDYELIDSGDGLRLERFGKYTVVRPDPQILWRSRLSSEVWEQADAVFLDGPGGTGKWRTYTKMPETWPVKYEDLVFQAQLSPFKHVGIFPEQAAHWDWMRQKIASAQQPVRVLNLFAYTGGASLAAVQAGAQVTHVDASRPAIGWAKRNQGASGLPADSIRWILDDVSKFVAREVRRGSQYEGIILDPPIYGHGPSGEKWKFHEHFVPLLQSCEQILSRTPLFVIINAYAISASSLMLHNVSADIFLSRAGKVASGELGLQERGEGGRYLSTGIYSRVEF